METEEEYEITIEVCKSGGRVWYEDTDLDITPGFTPEQIAALPEDECEEVKVLVDIDYTTEQTYSDYDNQVGTQYHIEEVRLGEVKLPLAGSRTLEEQLEQDAS